MKKILSLVFKLAFYITPLFFLDVHMIFKFVFLFLELIFPLSTVVFWIIGLVKSIQNIHNAFSIIYCIIFVIFYIPSLIAYVQNNFRELKIEKIIKQVNSKELTIDDLLIMQRNGDIRGNEMIKILEQVNDDVFNIRKSQ